MSDKESGNKVGKHIICSVGPDVCKTPMGSSMVPVAYTSIAFMEQSTRLATSVNNQGKKDFTLNSRISTSTGHEAGVGKGVKKAGYKGPAAVVMASDTVFSEGYPVVRNGDAAVINMVDLGPDEKQRKEETAPTEPSEEENREAQIKTALEDAKSALEKRKEDMAEWSDTTKEEFESYFGESTDSAKKVISERIDKSLDKLKELDETNVIYDADSPTYGYVYPDKTSKIYVGQAFDDAPAVGRDSKMGVIVHEVSHFNDVGSTDDHAYGITASKKLAQEEALYNADSFEYFVEDAITP